MSTPCRGGQGTTALSFFSPISCNCPQQANPGKSEDKERSTQTSQEERGKPRGGGEQSRTGRGGTREGSGCGATADTVPPARGLVDQTLEGLRFQKQYPLARALPGEARQALTSSWDFEGCENGTLSACILASVPKGPGETGSPDPAELVGSARDSDIS